MQDAASEDRDLSLSPQAPLAAVVFGQARTLQMIAVKEGKEGW